jgi:Uma2 family endonuclease
MTQLLDLQAEITAPNIDDLVIEDDAPVDNFQSEEQQRLLVEPLYSSWQPGQSFLAAANVGIFSSTDQESIVPDVFLSLGVERSDDYLEKQNRSYFVWRFGKFPEVVIEIVSNRKGNELTTKDPSRATKKAAYARLGIAYYAVFDPLEQIQAPDQMQGQLLKVFVLTGRHYVELAAPHWLDDVGLGLTVWQGEFEGVSGSWLRWCDQSGLVISTGKERAEQEAARATEASERATEAAQRATEATQRATEATQRATEAEALLERERQEKSQLLDRLRSMGIDPNAL